MRVIVAFTVLLISSAIAVGQGTPGTVRFPGNLDTPDSLFRIKDSSRTRLTSSITSSSTVINVESTATFDVSGSIKLDDEIVFYSSKTSSQFQGLTRGAAGSTAAAHAAGIVVRAPILAVHHNTQSASIVATQTKVGSGSSTPVNGAVFIGTGPGTSGWVSQPVIDCTNCINVPGGGGGSGDVLGPAASADGELVLFGTQTDGKHLKRSNGLTGYVKVASGVVSAAPIPASDLPSGIDAAKIGDGSVSSIEFQFLGNVNADVQTQLDNKVGIARSVSTSGPLTGGGTLIANLTLACPSCLTTSNTNVLDTSVAYCADSGSTDSYACSLAGSIPSLVVGGTYRFKANTANTGAATVNFSSFGAKAIKKRNDLDLGDNDIEAGQIVEVVYDGTFMQMQSQLATLPSGAGDMLLGTSQTVTAAKTFNDGTLIVNGGDYGPTDSSRPAGVEKAFYLNTNASSKRLFVFAFGDYHEVPLAGISLIGAASGGTGDDTSSTTGLPRLASGNWTYDAAASISETNAGTETNKALTPDALAGSNFGTRTAQLVVFDFTSDTTTGDGKYFFVVPAELNGMNLVGVSAQVVTAGATNTLNVDLARCAAVATGSMCSGTVADMLSTNLTIDSSENKSATAAAAAVIDTSNDDVATDQVIRVDVDAIHTTAAKGLIITLSFRLP